MRAHCYPYIGGDSMKAKGMPVAVCDLIPSLNLVLPFAIPSFLGTISNAHYYDFSMTALTNARDILKTLEENTKRPSSRSDAQAARRSDHQPEEPGSAASHQHGRKHGCLGLRHNGYRKTDTHEKTF